MTYLSIDAFSLLSYGVKNKIMSGHKLNMSSSRSHSILSFKIEQFTTENPNDIVYSKLELVDLAGSER